MPATDRRWFASDRGREIGFALALLVPVVLGFAGVEWLVRQRDSMRAGRVDWGALQSTVGIMSSDGMVRLKPNSQFDGMAMNSHGYRGPEVPVPAPQRTIRVAFIGDSKVLAADQPEAATLAARTIARLRTAVPGCRFDYVSMSGPGYTLSNLATLWHEDAPLLRPDIAVLLGGSVADLIEAPDPTELSRRKAAPKAGLEAVLAQSSAISLIGRELRMLSPATPVSDAASQPLHQLAARYRAQLAPLVQAMGATPTVAIGYRSQIGDPAAPVAQLLAARHLRQSFPGLSVEKATAVSELVVAELEQQAQASGWHFIDPVAAIQHDPAYFSDRSHFSARGHVRIAQAVADQITPIIGVDCNVVQQRR
jgi:hypothetical protein